jgi:hypothetical protein
MATVTDRRKKRVRPEGGQDTGMQVAVSSLRQLSYGTGHLLWEVTLVSTI